MNWGKVKTVMILILLLACLLLGFSIRSIASGRRYLDAETVANLYAILAEDDIIVAESALPRERMEPYVYYSALPEDYYGEVLSLMTDDAIARSFATPDDGFFFITENDDRFWIGKYFGFSYYSHAVGENNDSEVTGLNAAEPEQGTLLPAPSAFEGVSATEEEQRALLATAESFLNLDGFVSEEARSSYALSLKGLIRPNVGSDVYLLINLTVDGVPVATNELVLLLRHDGVVAADGSWAFLYGETRESAPIYDQVNILISEKKNIDIDRKSGNLSGPVAIRQVELCYCPYADEESGTVYYVPGWRVTQENGTVRVYDAVNNCVFLPEGNG